LPYPTPYNVSALGGERVVFAFCLQESARPVPMHKSFICIALLLRCSFGKRAVVIVRQGKASRATGAVSRATDVEWR
jgi:hypothetical protein